MHSGSKSTLFLCNFLLLWPPEDKNNIQLNLDGASVAMTIQQIGSCFNSDPKFSCMSSFDHR